MEMTQHSMRTSSSSKLTVPFYAPPPSCKKTSAEIISEARASIIRGTPLSVTVNPSKMSATIRPINTKRPFTPREKQRTLFGSSRKTSYRPPSSFSLGYLQFQELDAGSNTTPPFNVRRLNPLPSPPRSCSSLNSNSSSLEFNAWKTAFNEEMTCDPLEHAGLTPTKTDEMLTPVKFRLPSISTAIKHSKRKFRASASLDNLPEELEGDENEFVTSNPDTSRKEDSPIRKAYSSPVQRTRSVFNTELDRDFLADLRVSNTQPSQVNKRLLPLEKKTPQDVENFQQYNDLLGNSSKIAWENDTKKYKLSVELGKDAASLNLTKSSITNTTNDKIRVNQGEVDLNDGVNNSSLTQSSLKIENDFKISLTENSETAHILAVSSTNNLLEPDLSENKIVGMTKRKVKKGASHFSSSTSSQYPSSIIQHETGQFEKSDKENLMENYQSNKQRKIVDKYLTEGSSDKLSCHTSQKEIEDKFKPWKSQEDNKVGNLAISIEQTGQEENTESVQYILKVLSGIPANEENSAEVLLLLAKLYKFLEADGTIGKPSPSGKMKSQVLKELYRFVEVSNNNLLLQIARIILALRVNGSNLSGVCKLVFKVSRSDQNDKLFLEDNILELFVESLGSASPLEDAEACVYGYGALKFLTMNNVVLTKVLRLGTLELIVLHMKMINSARSEGSRISEQTSHALFQLTGALRNVAGEEYMFPHFVSTGAVTELCRTMELFSSDLDVISNVSRTFSIISTHDDCCSTIVDYEQSFKVFVKLFEKYPGRQDVMVRLGYAIGNLMAKNDVARTKFFVEEGAIKSMLNLLTIYLERDLEMVRTTEKISSSDAGSNGSVEDVIIKIIRILANMSINPIVGSSLACSSCTSVSSDCIQDNFGADPNKSKDGAQFLDVLLTVLQRKSVAESEELVHSVLSTLNNLSYYPTCNDGAFGERQLEMAQALCSLLSTEDKACLIEATRVYGNLSRSKDARDFILESGGMGRLLCLLDGCDRELLCTTAGVLINLMADWDKRLAFKQDGGAGRLINILSKYGEGDWQLATLVCQALWNYCSETTDLYSAFTVEEMNSLFGLLADSLDEERLFGVKEGTEVNETIASSAGYQIWEEFAGAATNLLEKMETFMDTVEPLEILSVNEERKEYEVLLSLNT